MDVEGAGHAANLTHPEPVNAAIRQFLDGLHREPKYVLRLSGLPSQFSLRLRSTTVIWPLVSIVARSTSCALRQPLERRLPPGLRQ